ncbi:hypothetical protein DOY81_012004 [Sarcophaga bullata]|nr:hypothetical protein DOY81_012004 [Sarcophaga bullata]
MAQDLRYLRDYGFGRRFQELELAIQEEITDMLHLIRSGPKYEHEKPYVKEDGYRILLPYSFSPFSVNSIFHIMFNERRSRSEQFKLWEMGTTIVPSLYAYHNDNQLWGDPKKFCLERFLDDQGILNLKRDVSLPIGAGKLLV